VVGDKNSPGCGTIACRKHWCMGGIPGSQTTAFLFILLHLISVFLILSLSLSLSVAVGQYTQ